MIGITQIIIRRLHSHCFVFVMQILAIFMPACRPTYDFIQQSIFHLIKLIFRLLIVVLNGKYFITL